MIITFLHCTCTPGQPSRRASPDWAPPSPPSALHPPLLRRWGCLDQFIIVIIMRAIKNCHNPFSHSTHSYSLTLTNTKKLKWQLCYIVAPEWTRKTNVINLSMTAIATHPMQMHQLITTTYVLKKMSVCYSFLVPPLSLVNTTKFNFLFIFHTVWFLTSVSPVSFNESQPKQLSDQNSQLTKTKPFISISVCTLKVWFLT